MAATGAAEGPLSELLDTLGRTTDGMVAVDGDLCIVGWNDAATKLLGFSADEVMGRPCYEVLGWRDRYGNSICDENCHARNPGESDEIIETRQVVGEGADGNAIWLSATTVVPPPEVRRRARLVHLVREVDLPPELERLVADRIGGHGASRGDQALLEALTPRQIEVLRLLSEGLDGPSIADRLYLSTATVRNHVQHILRKLGVHSRVEAVALYLRNHR